MLKGTKLFITIYHHSTKLKLRVEGHAGLGEVREWNTEKVKIWVVFTLSKLAGRVWPELCPVFRGLG